MYGITVMLGYDSTTFFFNLAISIYLYIMLLPSGNPFKCHEEDVLSLQPLIPPKHFDNFSPCLGDAQETQMRYYYV